MEQDIRAKCRRGLPQAPTAGTAIIAISLLGLGAHPLAVRADEPAWLARSARGMVAADSADASQAGAEILRRGGNAFDAAIATSLALTVARPESTGIGGGGFMLAYVAKERRFVVLDFRETAPAGATPERFAELAARRGDGPSASIFGGMAVGVPGLVAGLAEIHKRFGSQPWADVVRPAVELAERGMLVDDHFAAARREALRDFERWPLLGATCGVLRQFLSECGAEAAAGGRCPRAGLARALRQIADMGPSAFYEGPLAAEIVAAVQKAGGVLTADDLKSYRVREREPLRARYGDIELVLMPPPSSGGVCIAEAMNIYAGFAATPGRFPRPLDAPHGYVEALKHAFADRARWLGDPDFAKLPLARLLSPAYADELFRRIKLDAVAPVEAYGAATFPDDRGTSHFCVADRAGNVVALTETINGGFGSFVMTPEHGILLNNEMDDFLTVRGQANLFGLTQGEANLVGPGKRPLSSMSPTIVLRDGRPVLGLGGSGGPRIITSVLAVMLEVLADRPLDEAMTALRIHHQWQPDEIVFDREPPAELAERLRNVGHKLSPRRSAGCVQAIRFLPDGTMVGASDPGKGGRPAAP